MRHFQKWLRIGRSWSAVAPLILGMMFFACGGRSSKQDQVSTHSPAIDQTLKNDIQQPTTNGGELPLSLPGPISPLPLSEDSKISEKKVPPASMFFQLTEISVQGKSIYSFLSELDSSDPEKVIAWISIKTNPNGDRIVTLTFREFHNYSLSYKAHISGRCKNPEGGTELEPISMREEEVSGLMIGKQRWGNFEKNPIALFVPFSNLFEYAPQRLCGLLDFGLGEFLFLSLKNACVLETPSEIVLKHTKNSGRVVFKPVNSPELALSIDPAKPITDYIWSRWQLGRSKDPAPLLVNFEGVFLYEDLRNDLTIDPNQEVYYYLPELWLETTNDSFVIRGSFKKAYETLKSREGTGPFQSLSQIHPLSTLDKVQVVWRKETKRNPIEAIVDPNDPEINFTLSIPKKLLLRTYIPRLRFVDRDGKTVLSGDLIPDLISTSTQN